MLELFQDILTVVVNGLALGCIYGLIALGFVLIYKATEMVNFAQGDLMMLGAFVAYTLIDSMGFNYWLGLFGAIVIMAALGFALDAARTAMIDKIKSQTGAIDAAQSFGIDDVIDPRDTRRRLIETFASCPARRPDNSPPRIRPISPI